MELSDFVVHPGESERQALRTRLLARTLTQHSNWESGPLSGFTFYTSRCQKLPFYLGESCIFIKM